MNKDFPRILTLLRKEKGISQKNAAAELGISQALLSHYEKGIRECGLDFVARAADFYGASCDYLLGRSPNRDGMVLSAQDLPDPDAAGKENVFKGSLLPTLNKKLIENTLNILYDLLQRAGYKELTVAVSDYLFFAVYTLFRELYRSNEQNPQEMFALDEGQYQQLSAAMMILSRMQLQNILQGKGGHKAKPFKNTDRLRLSPERIATQYPLFATSLTNLIKNVENSVQKRVSLT